MTNRIITKYTELKETVYEVYYMSDIPLILIVNFSIKVIPQSTPDNFHRLQPYTIYVYLLVRKASVLRICRIARKLLSKSSNWWDKVAWCNLRLIHNQIYVTITENQNVTTSKIFGGFEMSIMKCNRDRFCRTYILFNEIRVYSFQSLLFRMLSNFTDI